MSSTTSLWILISGTTTLKSKEYVEKSLNENADRIIKGIQFYSSPARKRSDNQFEGITPKSIVDKLTSLLHIDSSHVNDILASYFSNEFTGCVKAIADQFKSDKNIQAFIVDVWKFHLSDRLYSLFLLKQILSNVHESSFHPYQDLFKSFIQSRSSEKSIVDSLISQLNELLNSDSIDYPQGMKGLAIEYSIRERFELDQLLVLALHNFSIDIQVLVHLLNVRSQFAMCTPQANNEHLDQIIAQSNVLEALTVVQGLSIGKLFTCIEDESSDHIFLKTPGKLQKLDEQINNLSFSINSNSVVFLGWIIIRSWEIEGLSPEEAPNVIQNLGSLAISMGVFDILQNFFTSNLFETILLDTKVGDVLKIVTGDLLSTLFKIYRMEKLVGGKKEQLFQLIKAIEFSDDVAGSTFNEKSESGLLTIIRESLYTLPTSLRPFLDIVTPISKTSSYQQLFNLMSSIQLFEEVLPSSSNYIELTGSPGCYRSTFDRVTGSGTVRIRKGQLGNAVGYSASNSSVTVHWEDISVSAWGIMTNTCKNMLSMLSSGRLPQIDDQTLDDVILINNFCSSFLPSLKKLTMEQNELLILVMDLFKLLAKHPKIPRKYFASALELSSVLSVHDSFSRDATKLWIMICDFGLLPYPTASFSKDEQNEQNFNPSFIGAMMSTFECIKGEYDLTVSFLNYIATILTTVGDDDVLISSVNFILNEIFPQYQLWHYKHQKEEQVIGYHCLTIASLALKSTFPALKSTVKQNLTHGKATDTILSIIRAGIITSGKVIENIGVHEALNTEEIVTIRLSLMLIEDLLLDTPRKGGDELSSGIEKAIFSSRGSIVKSLEDRHAVSSQNILLVLAHYVFQKVDPSLSTRSAAVMKVLATRHPLSMMSCLGPESESVKEHFLEKLESSTEDIETKVAILDFLAECVIHQPGLIEVFVTQEDGAVSDSILESVLLILEEKKEGIVNCPIELHSASLKFLSNFWVNTSVPVIESLKKNPKFWALLSFPCLEPVADTSVQDFDGRIISSIMRIIAREIFFEKRSNNQNQDPGFKAVLSFLPSRIPALSGYLKDMACDDVIREEDQEALIMHAWKDLLVSVARFNPVELYNDVKINVFENLLESILKQLQLNGSQKLIVSLAESCLLIVGQWSPALITSKDSWMSLNSSIVYVLNESKDSLDLNLLIVIESYIASSIQIMNSKDAKNFNGVMVTDLIHPVSDLLLHCLRILGKLMTQDRTDEVIVTNLCVTTMSLFNLLVTSTLLESALWIRVLKSNDILNQLCVLLHHLISNKLAIDLCEGIIGIMISLSNDAVTAEELVTTTNMDWMRVALKCDFNDVQLPNQQKNRWNTVYSLTIQLASTLLMNLKQFFVNDSLHLLVSNIDRFATSLQKVRTSPSLELLDDTNHILMFLRNLSKFKLFWSTNHLTSYEIIFTQVSMVIHSVASFLAHANLFIRLLDCRSRPFLPSSKKVAVIKQQQPNLDRSFSPSTTLASTTDSNKRELDPKIECLLYQISLVAIQFMIEALPSLEELMVIRKDPSKAQGLKLCLDRSFVEPNIDFESNASFGSLLTILDITCSLLRKMDGKNVTGGLTKEILEQLAESSLFLMVTQSIVSQVDSSIPSRDQQLISRELQSRLSSFKRRSSSSKRSSSSNLSRDNSFINQNQTITHLIHILEDTCPSSDN